MSILMHKNPEPRWQDIQSVLENNGFVEIKFDDNWYVFMQKGKKNIRIPKLNKISKPCLDSIIQASDIDENMFLDALRK
ncbi:MAG: hypothetical protein OES19_01895 [Nitrosopumilus sp.]|nr:hypothetical protein [Nitrosopumilus sp.]MDH3832919.1 hypothetical protein [Nitrosopumilus sp.]